MGWTGHVVVAGVLLGSLPAQVFAQGIYTCIDGQGRRLTADRPIAECADREQSELFPSGTVKRRIGPTLTAEEHAAEEEKARRLQEERSAQAEEKRRERALLTRYPNRATHDRERTMALTQIDGLIGVASKRGAELEQARKRLDTELEFFAGDPSRAPAALRRQIEENRHDTEAQKRFIANQEAEKQRIGQRFDEELARLKVLWAQRGTVTATRPGSAASAKR